MYPSTQMWCICYLSTFASDNSQSILYSRHSSILQFLAPPLNLTVTRFEEKFLSVVLNALKWTKCEDVHLLCNTYFCTFWLFQELANKALKLTGSKSVEAAVEVLQKLHQQQEGRNGYSKSSGKWTALSIEYTCLACTWFLLSKD